MNNVILTLIIIGALLYLVFPRDLIPDFLLGWGWIDDLAVLYILWRYYRRLKQAQQTGARGNRAEQPHRQTAGDEQSRAADSEKRHPQDPYAILGILPGATKEEIKKAYRRLAGQYHPDKVQHLGKEFQELAEKRFKDIQQAYNELTSR